MAALTSITSMGTRSRSRSYISGLHDFLLFSPSLPALTLSSDVWYVTGRRKAIQEVAARMLRTLAWLARLISPSSKLLRDRTSHSRRGIGSILTQGSHLGRTLYVIGYTIVTIFTTVFTHTATVGSWLDSRFV